MNPTWVIAVEGGRARIFELRAFDKPMRELADLVNPATRVPDHELDSDRPGRTFDSSGPGRHAMEPRTDPARRKQAGFAEQIAARLESGRLAGEFRDVIIIAAPAMLGLLRRSLTKAVRQQVKREISRNVVREDEGRIRNLLQS